MALVVKSIGSAGGRDYSTIAGWAAGLPANLVTDGNSYQGECYADSEFVSVNTILDIGGLTTDASHTVTLTTAAGQSFRDNASVQSNALRYNAANGVALRTTSSFWTIRSDIAFFTISKLQIKNDGGYRGVGVAMSAPDVASNTLEFCIVHSAASDYPAVSSGVTNVVHNCLLIQSGGHYPVWDGEASINGGGAYYFCTIVAPSDSSDPAAAVRQGYGSPIFVNSAFFGCTAVTVHDGGGGASLFQDCMTDVASPPSGVIGSKTYANQFENTVNATADFRIKSGADLIGAGADSSNSAFDIAGTSRPQGGNWDVGAWELVVVAPAGGQSGITTIIT